MEEDWMVSPDLIIKPGDQEDFKKYVLDRGLQKEIISQNHYEKFLESRKIIIKSKPKREGDTKVEIIKEYNPTNRKRNILDWIKYYNDRFEKIKNILMSTRQELYNTTSITSIFKSKRDREKISIIGMVKAVTKTKKGNVFFDVEDPTGKMRAIVLHYKSCFKDTENLVNDEVVGVLGSKSKDVVFVDKIIQPDIPERPFKKCKDDVYACYISDTHAGSNMFLEKQFSKFIGWLNGDVGDTQLQALSRKVKYLFFIGDLVDGVGIYPAQEKELHEKDIYKQYDIVSNYIKQIPEDINIVIIPGNHDALQTAEPQHKLFEDFCKDLYGLGNVTMSSNPCWVNAHKLDGFPGFTNLLYHGYSFDEYINNIPKLREKGYTRADYTMQFLLKKRHLAPIHGSTLIVPRSEDFLVIDPIPDIFAAAHVHNCSIDRYKNVLLLVSSCWQARTTFQERMGHVPEPCVVPLFGFKDNKTVKLRFDT